MRYRHFVMNLDMFGITDYYPTDGGSHFTLSTWNIMDGGAYLNDGKTPPTYSAFDRFFLNWLAPTELKSSENFTLQPLTSSNNAYLISKDGNHNLKGNAPNPTEFFMLENRQNSGWDNIFWAWFTCNSYQLQSKRLENNAQ